MTANVIFTLSSIITLSTTGHLMIFGGKSNEVSVEIGEANVKESKEEKLLGIIFDQTICFKQHVKTLCMNTSQKLHALTRISCYMDIES